MSHETIEWRVDRVLNGKRSPESALVRWLEERDHRYESPLPLPGIEAATIRSLEGQPSRDETA